MSCNSSSTEIQAAWSKASPRDLHIDWLGLNGRDDGSTKKCFTPEQTLRVEGAAILDVVIREPKFYEANFDASLKGAQFAPRKSVSAGNNLLFKPQLWGKSEVLYELSEALFSGQDGHMRLLFENTGDTPIQITDIHFNLDKAITSSHYPDQVMVAPHSEVDILIPLKVPFEVKPGLYDSSLSFQSDQSEQAYTENYKIAVYRLVKSERKTRLGSPGSPEIELDCTFGVDTPFHCYEEIHFRQIIQVDLSSKRLEAKIATEEFNALVRFPTDVNASTVALWGEPMPITLMTNYYSIGSVARKGFGVLTGAAAAGFAALGAAAAKAALSTLLALVLSPLLSPYAFFLVALFILTASFETWWSVFIGAAAGMTGFEINLAIWDEIADVVS